jgi:hypothetical protein
MMGRPPKPEGEAKTNTLRIRMTDAERAELDTAASRAGEETSTWARALLLAGARGPAPKARNRR